MNGIRFIYFDLDDTLLDHAHAERHALTATVNDFGEVFDGHSIEEVLTVYHKSNLALWRDYALGRISKADLQSRRFSRLIDNFGLDGVDPEEIGNTYLGHYPSFWKYCDGADRVFHQLADSFQVGVITNGFEATQVKKLNSFADMRDRLATTIISETIGYLKPDPRLFSHAAQEAGLDGHEILYIGDSFESDIEGAQNAGWRVAWYLPDESRRRETDAYTFDNWDSFDLSRVR